MAWARQRDSLRSEELGLFGDDEIHELENYFRTTDYRDYMPSPWQWLVHFEKTRFEKNAPEDPNLRDVHEMRTK